ncbi:hypothetical protein [Nocardiopsis sp. LOL_012]|uniref:hypothetical protein n=1 Tax=Nocardiopsis sp. LOL_012 TaxID=3345409 RepID=UPI003A872D71
MNAGNAGSGPHQSLLRYRPDPGYRPIPDALPRRVRRDPDGILWGEVPVVPVSARDGRTPSYRAVVLVDDHPRPPTEPPPVSPRTVVPDLPGYDMKPDPMTAATPAEFVDVMRRYRKWAGSPSFRKMAERGGLYSAAAFCDALKSDRLPRFTLLNAFVVACDGTEGDWQRWLTAWRRLGEGGDDTPAVLVPLPPPR